MSVKEENTKLNQNADYFIISDAHVGSHGCNDCCNYKKLIPFLKEVHYNTKATLVLNGDFFEFMKSFKSNVIRNNKEISAIISELKTQNRLIHLKGNHDFSSSNQKELIINNSILVLHGDIFEKTTNSFLWFNYFLHLGISFIERIFRMNINKIMKVFLGYDRLKNRGLKIEKKAMDYIKKRADLKAIIVGHTHTPQSNYTYHNCGCFTEDNSDYIEITDNNISLKKY
jgi:UDP-2,3-diacylglucosamine pyrophosphatase LpxH